MYSVLWRCLCASVGLMVGKLASILWSKLNTYLFGLHIQLTGTEWAKTTSSVVWDFIHTALLFCHLSSLQSCWWTPALIGQMQTQGQRKHQAKVTTERGKTWKLCKPHYAWHVILPWNDSGVGGKNALETGVLRDHSSARPHEWPCWADFTGTGEVWPSVKPQDVNGKRMLTWDKRTPKGACGDH